MSFFDKVKAGVAEAGSKAKVVVEINKLKMQNHTKTNEIEQQYTAIGKLVYIAKLEGTTTELLEPQLEPHYNTIQLLQTEIKNNLQHIKFLSEASEA